MATAKKKKCQAERILGYVLPNWKYITNLQVHANFDAISLRGGGLNVITLQYLCRIINMTETPYFLFLRTFCIRIREILIQNPHPLNALVSILSKFFSRKIADIRRELDNESGLIITYVSLASPYYVSKVVMNSPLKSYVLDAISNPSLKRLPLSFGTIHN